jgi:hypothetical protein
MNKENSGFGSESLEQRLKMIYKNFYSLEKSFSDGIFTAQLTINLSDFYDKVRYTR